MHGDSGNLIKPTTTSYGSSMGWKTVRWSSKDCKNKKVHWFTKAQTAILITVQLFRKIRGIIHLSKKVTFIENSLTDIVR